MPVLIRSLAVLTVTVALSTSLALPAAAQEPESFAAPGPLAEDEETGTLTLILENDLFYNIDRHYTNGVQAIWTDGPGAAPGWARDLSDLVPLFPRKGSVRTAWKLGQAMFTADDITDPDPPPDGRPYAGWLYGSVGLIAETGDRLDQLEFTLGVVGPLSFAEESQKIVHEIVGSPEPQGWDTQLKNEPGLVISYQRSWRQFVSERVAGFAFDVTPHLGGAVGNIYTYLDGGLMLRVGRHLPQDYGPPRLSPSLPGSGFYRATGSAVGWYLFAGMSGRVTARNIFLDGNTFRDSRSVDREWLVGDLQLGAAVTVWHTRLTYTHVFRTKEFASQDEPDQFAALAVSWRF